MTRTSKRANPLPRGIPGTFDELVRVWIPKAIHDRVEFQNALIALRPIQGWDKGCTRDSAIAGLVVRAHQPE